MLPALSVLIDLQVLDSAIDAARRRLAEIPVAEKAPTDTVAGATAQLAAAKQTLSDATASRKLVLDESGETWLYHDLSRDPGEQHNLAAAPEYAAEIAAARGILAAGV